MKSGRLFTIGYEQRSIVEFVHLLRDSDIDILIDVRETAWRNASSRRVAE